MRHAMNKNMSTSQFTNETQVNILNGKKNMQTSLFIFKSKHGFFYDEASMKIKVSSHNLSHCTLLS